MCFDILGFDIIIDNNFKPFILEVNHSPSFNLDTALDKFVKIPMISSCLDILNISVKK